MAAREGRWLALRNPGVGAGLSTALALIAGLAINAASSGATLPIVAGLGVLGATWIGFEVWRANVGPPPTGPSPARDDPRRPWMAPPLDRILERPQIGDPLLAALGTPAPPGGPGPLIGLHGAGGFGKTRMATWACHREEIDRRFPGGLLWVNLGQDAHGPELAVKINDVTATLTGSRPPITDPDVAGAELGRLLDERPPVLLVIDDVWDRRQLNPFRIGGRQCTRLVTTRIPDTLPADSTRITVQALSTEQARVMVTEGLPSMPDAFARELVQAGHHWPVLLNAINGGLHRRIERGQRVDEAARAVLDHLATAGPTALDRTRPVDRTGVGPTVEASVGLLDPADQQRWAELVIFPEDADIPLDVLALLWPERSVPDLCDDLVALGLVADYRLDAPGPRLVLHDLIREYLRWRQRGTGPSTVHRRLVTAAQGLLREPSQWWALPDDATHLWRWLPFHLREAGFTDELRALVTDLRWVEGKARRFGTVAGAAADLRLVDGDPVAAALADVLRRSASLLRPIEPPAAVGATLVGRVHGIPGLEDVLDRYRETLARPRLEPAWPMPDRFADTGDSGESGAAAGVNHCAFSADGRMLALACDDGAVRLWDCDDEHFIRTIHGHTGGVNTTAFSPDGTTLATAGQDGALVIRRISDGRVLHVLRHDDCVTGAVFSPDGTMLASSCTDGRAQLWDVAHGTRIMVLQAHHHGVDSCAFSPDGTRLATAGDDGVVRIWRVVDGQSEAGLTGHRGPVNDCTFSPDGTRLATAGRDHTARIWRVADGTVLAELVGHGSRVNSCRFSPDGTVLATTGVGSVRLWSATDGREIQVMSGHQASVKSVAFSPDSALLATASLDQTARLVRIATGETTVIAVGSGLGVVGCALSPDGRYVATTSLRDRITVRRVDDGSVHLGLHSRPDYARGCAFSPDGSLLATAGIDGAAHLWSMADGSEVATVAGHDDWATSCAFSPDGTLLATAGHDRTVRLTRLADRTEAAVFRGHTDQVNSCAFSPDGTLLISGSDERTVRLWSVPDGAEIAVLRGHTDQVDGCAFSPDGTLVASCGDDRTVRLWSVADGAEVAVLRGHTYKAQACAFSPDGTVVASTGTNGTVRVWEVATGRVLTALRVTGRLSRMAWHPDGTRLCAAGGSGLYVLRYVP
jgi:WD40 repeat protein